jgi:hypothetical protein
MPRNETIQIFKFSELSDEAKKVARQWWIDGDRDDSSQLSELFITDLESHYMFPMERVYFSLGSCQGDGVAFEGAIPFDELLLPDKEYGDTSLLSHRVKIREMIERLKALDIELSGKVTHKGRYYHWNSMNVSIDGTRNTNIIDDLTDAEYKLVNDLEEAIAEYIKDLSRKLEKDGYADIEARQEDDYVDDCLVANEYEFTEDGEMWNGD